MSRIGNRPIIVDDDVSISSLENKVTVKSKKGEIDFDLPEGIYIDISDNLIRVKKRINNKDIKALHGLSTRIIRNMMIDAKVGYNKILEFKGTGYRAKIDNGQLVLNMGYSHDILLKVPDNINVIINKNKIIIEGIDRVIVGQFASKIRDVRPPEVYKGKGIKYESEIIKKKAGKAAQATTGKA